ncbi:uncharacterized protein N7446_011371 [Penicillium canescens]|uniref:uncharacterized protein n=1 Tax=Penicillium canescens TaxID=5083 RepID=UPI0026DF6CF8|nr:uncharacterized protein N7446_011371 [Penicillium canescens]KAJ6048688.1 hypothetical protein N7446_011371 [Penicillium canescens]
MAVSLKSRTEGAIWGVCIADALGGPVQFKDPNTFEPITGLRYVAPFKQPAGSYSDDGSMTLALAYSFVESEMQYNHIMSIKFYVEWMTHGRFSTIDRAWDMGHSTRKSLSIWKKSRMENIEGAQARIDIELDSEERSGNGSLMRIAPGRVTHPSLPCVEACEAYTELVCGVMNGHTKQQLFDTISAFPFTHPALKERMAQYKTITDWTAKTSGYITSSGWVVDTLEVALWAFFKYDSWKEGALAVVNRGGDSDTAGAVYGGLAGAYYGVEFIPQEWKDGMQRKDFIGGIANKLAQGVVDASSK